MDEKSTPDGVEEVREWSSQMRRGVLELGILALLEKQTSYGYEIATTLATVPRLEASEGTVYPLLRRLKKLGWLATSWRPSQSGPPRQYYELTPEGAAYLEQLRGAWSELRRSVDALLYWNERPGRVIPMGSRIRVDGDA